MAQLCRSGMITPHEQADRAFSYHYEPGTAVLRPTIDTLAELYSRQLLDVTHLIHAKLDRKAQQFADDFKWLSTPDGRHHLPALHADLARLWEARARLAPCHQIHP